MSDCIFCRIVAGQIPATVVYSDEHCIAFNDIHPKARVHVLVIPRVHLHSLAETGAEHQALLGHMTLSLAKIAKQQGLNNGFRTVVNTGKEGGQEVFHLHYHVMGPI